MLPMPPTSPYTANDPLPSVPFLMPAAMSPQIGTSRHAMGHGGKPQSHMHLPYNQALQEEYAGGFQQCASHSPPLSLEMRVPHCFTAGADGRCKRNQPIQDTRAFGGRGALQDLRSPWGSAPRLRQCCCTATTMPFQAPCPPRAPPPSRGGGAHGQARPATRRTNTTSTRCSCAPPRVQTASTLQGIGTS